MSRLLNRWRAYGNGYVKRRCFWLGFVILFVAGLSSSVVAGLANERADRAEERANRAIAGNAEAILQGCLADNGDRLVQLQSLLDRRRMTAAYDFTSLGIQITPEGAERLRAQSLESIDRQIVELPFTRCPSGERLPRGVLPDPSDQPKGNP